MKRQNPNDKSSYLETIAIDPSTLLSTEMVIETFSYLERGDLKAVRLVCRRFDTLASPSLFTKAYIAARRGVMDVFKQITSHPVLSNYIREIIYDASWFEPSIAASLEIFSQSLIARGARFNSPTKSDQVRRDYKTYVRLFDEQERIISDELPMALDVAFKFRRHIRRVTFADFSRTAYLVGDKAEDFGNAFHSRCGLDSWKTELTYDENLQRLPRKFGTFILLMKALSASASLESVECFSAGDGALSSENTSSSGIPHIFFSARCEALPRGVYDGLRHLRRLDLSILIMGTTTREVINVEVDALKELLNMADCLEELRLINANCPPPRPRHKSASLIMVCGSKTWKNLRTLELRHFKLESLEVLHFLRRHKHCLRKIDIDDLALLDSKNWLSFCESVHIEYPNLHISPNSKETQSIDGQFTSFTIIGTTDAREGEAVPIDWVKLKRLIANNGYDRDVDWIFGDESGSYSDNESFTDNDSSTSEELQFSAGSDDDTDLDSLLGRRKSSKRSFMVPFERDSEFVGRMDIIAELDQKLSSQRRVALVGIGGVGKSQIAIEYCYMYRDKHPDASVFWVRVGTMSRFKQAYEAIANDRGLVGKEGDDPKANTLQLVTDWLNKKDNGSWLMILDGADDEAVFESRYQITEEFECSTSLARYLPGSLKGSIIITARNKRVVERLTCGEKPLMVSLFDGHMAKLLLRLKLDQSIEWVEEDADKLVETLEFLPLAVTQAAGFISNNNTTIKKYTEIVRASNSGLTNLLNQDLIDLKRDFDGSSSIIRTWQVAFDHIRAQKPRAAELLSLMALLDRQGIPKALLWEDDMEQIEIVPALGTLQDFSLVSSDEEGEVFEVHRLVQLSTLKWLDIQNEKLNWQEQALRNLSANFPPNHFVKPRICALYLPHVMTIIDSMILRPDHVNQLDLLVYTASYLRSQGQYGAAEQIVRRALELYEKIHGNEHSDTLRTMTMLGEILNDSRKYNDAEEVHRNVLVLRERTLGGKDAFTLSTIRSLAGVLINLKKYNEAKEMLEQNVKSQAEIWGEEHEITLTDMRALLVAYNCLGENKKAEALGVQVLEKHQKVLGVGHPATWSIMINLATTYTRLKRLSEAGELQVQVLDACKLALGAEHPSVLSIMGRLAVTYRDSNRLSEAEKLQVHVVEKHEKLLGLGHADTWKSIQALAATRSKMFRLDPRWSPACLRN